MGQYANFKRERDAALAARHSEPGAIELGSRESDSVLRAAQDGMFAAELMGSMDADDLRAKAEYEAELNG